MAIPVLATATPIRFRDPGPEASIGSPVAGRPGGGPCIPSKEFLFKVRSIEPPPPPLRPVAEVQKALVAARKAGPSGTAARWESLWKVVELASRKDDPVGEAQGLLEIACEDLERSDHAGARDRVEWALRVLARLGRGVPPEARTQVDRLLAEGTLVEAELPSP